MIVWGWSTKEIGTKETNGTCPSCSSPNLVVVGLQRVFDIFWIPIIPLGKSTCIRCNSCALTYVHEASPDEAVIQDNGFKTPWWSFSGLAIFIFLIIMGYKADLSTQEEHASFKENPTVGAHFTFRDMDDANKEAPYVFAKIEEVEGDMVVLRFSTYAYSKNSMATTKARAAKNNSEDLLDQDLFEATKENFKKLDIQTLID